MSENLYSPDTEHHFLGLLLNEPSLWVEVAQASERDFSPIRQRIFSVIRQQLESTPPQSVSPIILTEKLKSYGQSTTGDVDTLTFLEGLQRRGRLIEKKDAQDLLKNLKRLTAKRDFIEKCDNAKREITRSTSFAEMTSILDSTLNSINTQYYKPSETQSVFGDIIHKVEERGNNPIKTEDLGFQGPFPSINDTLGSIVFPGSFTVVAARTGGQKSTLAFFYNLYLAEKYNLPILHLDSNEMTLEQIQMRAICCMSQGQIPLWAVKSGEWRLNKEWENIVRHDIWPRVKKVNIQYQNIGNMSADEVVNFIKRFYFRYVGRGNHLLINLDYIKGSESFSKNTSEYQAVGYYVDKLKNLVTEQITGSIWTSAQNNREGIITGKKANEIVDSESSISLSDRIIQQSTHGFSMRFKVPEELAKEGNRFGNIRLTPLKTRESLGRNYERSIMPVRLPDGKHVKNYYNLNAHGFHFRDMGDLVNMLEVQGMSSVDIASNRGGQQMP